MSQIRTELLSRSNQENTFEQLDVKQLMKCLNVITQQLASHDTTLSQITENQKTLAEEQTNEWSQSSIG